MVQRLNGQMRVSGLGAITGLDMNAAFTMGAALGVNAMALAEFLPGIEAVMVRSLNKQLEGGEIDRT